ncbi:hypothetical protein Tco_0692343, partial [Tanacetum coccineum]
AKPTEKHLTIVKRVFRYLKGTINMGLWYPKDTRFDITASVDADHAGCQDSRKSTSMPPLDANKPYTKPPTKKQIQAFIKKLGYDEDLNAKMTSVLIFSIPRRSDSELHNEGQDSPLTKLTNTVVAKFKFGMEIPDTMINDAIKQLAGYKYYKHKRNESEKAKFVEEPKEQHVSPVRTGKGRDYKCSYDQEPVAVELAKSISIEEQRHQQLPS